MSANTSDLLSPPAPPTAPTIPREVLAQITENLQAEFPDLFRRQTPAANSPNQTMSSYPPTPRSSSASSARAHHHLPIKKSKRQCADDSPSRNSTSYSDFDSDDSSERVFHYRPHSPRHRAREPNLSQSDRDTGRRRPHRSASPKRHRNHSQRSGVTDKASKRSSRSKHKFKEAAYRWEQVLDFDLPPPPEFPAILQAKLERRCKGFDFRWSDTLLTPHFRQELAIASNHMQATMGISTQLADVPGKMTEAQRLQDDILKQSTMSGLTTIAFLGDIYKTQFELDEQSPLLPKLIDTMLSAADATSCAHQARFVYVTDLKPMYSKMGIQQPLGEELITRELPPPPPPMQLNQTHFDRTVQMLAPQSLSQMHSASNFSSRGGQGRTPAKSFGSGAGNNRNRRFGRN
ncbi:hypothetical protein BLNAU_12441 [Blattamonas nauphoetae]|uniref:Uncharacterized protein n=1 Tax=Blattamonas nauphoetae TaxID=2049346 RepID=A0ABQ9XJK8_9EUKA|nr:hypothetical protein BLNAU_12441 [Blattamonas nauphoetae]